ncbi:MAG: UPF0182 family protein [Chlorobi bacterium]|nr:UPF0182 family protein [Chlorobiota bacterium]
MKKYKSVIIALVVIVAILYLFSLFMDYYGDWLWFKNMEYGLVFDTILLAKIISFLLFSLIFILFSGLHIRFAYRRGKAGRARISFPADDPRQQLLPLYQGKALVWLWSVVLLFFAFVMGSYALSHWNDFLKFIHASSFGLKEPVFGIDAGFYVFKLPVYQFLSSWYLLMVVITFLAVLLSSYLDNDLMIKENKIHFSKQAKSHLIRLTAFFVLGISALYVIKLYNILFSTHGVAYGPSYMDIHAKIPAYWTMLVISLIITLVLFIYPVFKKRKVIVYALAVWVFVWVTFVWAYPRIIEQFVVKPNELKKESPYILNNIKFTREAFGLNKIKVKPFPVDQTLTYNDILENHHTIENIRLWDRRPLIQTYKQLQEIRLYYNFKNVQVDRYHFKKYTEVALGARELPVSQIPVQAQTWLNEHLFYTHGYGIVMSPVNEVTPNGMPRLIVKDIPPTTTVPLNLKQMAVYYGEETDQYVLVNTKVKEFNYPKGNENVYANYEGMGGVHISSVFRRLVYAWKFSDIKILITGYLTDKSRIMFFRNIMQRDKTLAPFLSFDGQSYPVVGKDGKLYWIHDAYTTSNLFPYSTPVYQNLTGKETNYINNSVKVVIDAYNGDVSFYVINPDDPLIQTYQKIYPKLFKPFSAMPDFLKEHIRYPTDLFSIQVKMYNVYHMTDPKVFYNQEDYWQIPKEIYNSGQQEMFPYYIIMRLPGTQKEEFILMLPFTPSHKDNMIAWMCARCDAPNYGDLIVYSLPKDKLIYGPMQIEARINQKPDISSELTLWGQQGSQVIKGNQLVIPIKNSFIYVEPVYLQSEEGQIPQLKRVIVAYKEKIEMKKTLDEALQAVFNVATGSAITPRETLTGNEIAFPLFRQAREALNHYNNALNYLKQADWNHYGDELKQMQSILNQMVQTKPKGDNKNK